MICVCTLLYLFHAFLSIFHRCVQVSCAEKEAMRPMSSPSPARPSRPVVPLTQTALAPQPWAKDTAIAPYEEDYNAGLDTGDDVIAYFSHLSKHTPIKFVYAGRARVGLQFRPYNLAVIPEPEPGQEHFVISATGVVNATPGQPSEVIPLSTWTRESMMFNIITKVKFFRHYLVRKSFSRWRENAQFNQYCHNRQQLGRNLFLAKSTFSATTAEMFKLSYDLAQNRCLIVPSVRQEYTVDRFRAEQNAQHHKAMASFAKTLEIMESRLLRLAEEVTGLASVPDLKSQESLEQYLLNISTLGKDNRRHGSKSTSMAEQRKNLQHQMAQLKRAMSEHDSLAHFIRLCDYAAAEALFQASITTMDSFLEALKLPDKQQLIMFQVQMSFQGEQMCFIPSENDVVDVYTELIDDMVSQLGKRPRLLYLHPCKVHFSSHPKTFSVGNAIRDDHRYNHLLSDTRSLIALHYKQCADFSQKYAGYRKWFVFVEEEWPAVQNQWAETDANNLSSQDFSKYMDKLKECARDLKRLYVTSIGILFLNSAQLATTLQDSMKLIFQSIKSTLIECARKQTQKLHGEFSTRIKALGERPATLKTFAAFVQSINTIREECNNLTAYSEEIDALYNLASENNIELSHDDIARWQQVVGGGPQQSQQVALKEQFLSAISTALETKSSLMTGMTQHLEKNIEDSNDDLLTTLTMLKSSEYSSAPTGTGTAEVLPGLQTISDVLTAMAEKVDTYNEYTRLFDLPAREWTNLHDARKLFQVRMDEWGTLAKFREKRALWYSTHLDSLDVEVVRTEINEFFKKAFLLSKENKDEVAETLLQQVKEEKANIPMIMLLGNKHMKKQHWNRIFAGMNKLNSPEPPYTLDSLRAWKVFDHRKLVEEQSTIATGETALFDTLDKIKTLWGSTDFETKLYRDTRDTYILGSLEEIMQQLEDHQVLVQTTLASRYVTGIRSRVEDWDSQLATVAAVLEEWTSCQKSWMYLEYVLSSDDMKAQLPSESRMFAQIDRDFRDLTFKAHQTPNVLALCTEMGVLQMLKDNNSTMEHVQKKMEEYLEVKRSIFPRFYFLTNDELLSILSDVRNPRNVVPHLVKCFDNIKDLTFQIGAKGTEIVSMISSEGEQVPFSKPVLTKGNVEDWLCNIERAMHRTLGDLLSAANAEFSEETRTTWYFQFPGQAVQLADQIMWTATTEQALDDMTENTSSLASYLDVYGQLVDGLSTLVQNPLTSIQRALVTILIITNVHNREILGRLKSLSIASPSDYEWQSQLRYYYEDAELLVKMGEAKSGYTYEYLGVSPRLVITPLTDRCYLTCMGALNLMLGGAPQGPAGTGKTETVKDLAKSLGRNCVVFNCSDGIETSTMGRMFAGLAQSGAWACFDEFNRLDVEVLSVVAQQVLEISSSLAANMTRMTFGSRDIRLSKNFGVFITMNPGYAGRTELPDNLQTMFRPVCMMIPDYALIAEIMFYSEGFKQAKLLAGKMVQLYKLASEQLSKQDHYDFGMRAVKSLLVMAGAKKRANPGADEDIMLIQAMRDSNLPKFLANDVELFNALVRDLFPYVTMETPPLDHLAAFAAQDLLDHHLQPLPSVVEKVMQLQDTVSMRHGVMLVGPAETGKTTVTSCLRRSLAKLFADGTGTHPQHVPAHVHRVNPKALSIGELYGQLNEYTQEWSDGILAYIARGCVKASTHSIDRHWIAFDGPVDAGWIENMNTVLDDNKMLCLFNGERIKLPDSITFVFEVQDLMLASPATVSRCGMVYLENSMLTDGWTPRVQTFCSIMEAKHGAHVWQTSRLLQLMSLLIPKTLIFLRKNCKEYVRSLDAQLALSLVELLDAMLSKLTDNDDEADEHEQDISEASIAHKAPVEGQDGQAPVEAQAPEGAGTEGDQTKQDKDIIVISDDTRPTHDLLAVDMDNVKVFDMYFVQAFIWSLGGNLDGVARGRFDSFARNALADVAPLFPAKGQVYDYYVHKSTLSWMPWAYKVPNFLFHTRASPDSHVVPTAQNIALGYMLSVMVSAGKHVLVNGATGVGKSLIVQQYIESKLQDVDSQGQAAHATFAITLSAQTSSAALQDLFEDRLVKRKQTLLSPPPGTTMLAFVDDINLPRLDTYQASPARELLRQILDDGGFYDRKKFFFKRVTDTRVLAACGPPGGGRCDLHPRLSTKFYLLCAPVLSQATLKRLFGCILQGFLTPFSEDVRNMLDGVLDCTIEIFSRITTEQLPTPEKSHYTFNLRDFSRVVQGLMQVSPKHCTRPTDFLKLWVHECTRVFHDRLTTEDRAWWWHIIRNLVHGQLKMPWDEAYQDLMFGDYLDRETRSYRESLDMVELQTALTEYQLDYNSLSHAELDLVFFPAVVQHLSRLCRILRQPHGHAMLIGVSGTGKRSLVQLASYISDMNVFQIKISRNYKTPEFRADLRMLMLEAGTHDRGVVFQLTDSQITQEVFLEDVNMLLTSGTIPGLLQTEDYEKAIEAVRERAKAAGVAETRSALIDFFTGLAKTNLHIVLCMSPIGDKFRDRLQQFPSLVSTMTLDWFDRWPADALLKMAQRHLHGLSFGGAASGGTAGLEAGLARLCVAMHNEVEKQTMLFKMAHSRHVYVTPTSYLELVKTFVHMFHTQSHDIQAKVHRFASGIDRLVSTNQKIAEMEVTLTALQPNLAKAAKETDDLMVLVEADQKEAAVVKEQVAKEERECQIINDDAAAIRDDCQKDLDEAMPSYYAAVDALKALRRQDIDEIKRFANPPEPVKLVMDAVLVLLQEKPGWENAKKVMADMQFIARLQNYDKDSVPESVIRKVSKYINDESFLPDVVGLSSFACCSLCIWVRAIHNYTEVVKKVQPKKLKLHKAEQRLDGAKHRLHEVSRKLQAQEEKVMSLKQRMQESRAKKHDLEQEMAATKAKIERAKVLTEGLGSENERWQEQLALLKTMQQELPGNVLLGAGVVAYLGPFTYDFRATLLKSWKESALDLGIVCNHDFTLPDLVDATARQQWAAEGLPLDSHSVENAAIIENSRRWCLCTDPQGQFNSWLKARHGPHGLRLLRPDNQHLVRTFEQAIQVGQRILLENVGEHIDPILDPVLGQATFKQGTRTMVTLADNDTDWDPAFRLFLTTQLANPHYLPEMQTMVTLLNCAVTPKALEDQLLVDVVRNERPELEEQHASLVTQIAEKKATLQELEDDILSMLASTPNILENEELANTLQSSNSVAHEVKADVKKIEVTSADILRAREVYRSVAARGSLLFQACAAMTNVDQMYQTSLAFFRTLFKDTIAKEGQNRADLDNGDGSSGEQDVEAHIKKLIPALTWAVYSVTCRGIFERHKPLFSFLISTAIMRSVGAIKEQHWQYYTRGLGMVQPPEHVMHKRNTPSWMSERTWRDVACLVHASDQDNSLGFQGLITSMKNKSEEWKEWTQDLAKGTNQLPPPYDSAPSFCKLLLVKVLKPGIMATAASELVAAEAGAEYTEAPQLDLEQVYADSSAASPIVFVLSTGSDPTASFMQLAHKKGYGDKKLVLSLGQGQGPKAQQLIDQGTRNGAWVFLQNCHLCASWMPALEAIVVDLEQRSDINPGFRLWLTSAPSLDFPVPVLQLSHKITDEPPTGVKANMRNTLSSLVQEKTWDSNGSGVVKRIIFGLAFFHAVIQERRKFGSISWNKHYPWNNSDLTTCFADLPSFVPDGSTVQWKGLLSLFSSVHYGGRVTDFLDQRCLSTCLSSILSPYTVDSASHLDKLGLVSLPGPDETLASAIDRVNALAPELPPEVFGLHSNADLTFQSRQSQTFFETLLSTQPATSTGGLFSQEDEQVANLANDVLSQIPEPILLENAHPVTFAPAEGYTVSSLGTFLTQEVAVYNKLLVTVKASLELLLAAIKGLVVMDADTRDLFTCFLFQRVPKKWQDAYPSLLPLSQWVADFLSRVDMVREWVEAGPRTSFWLGGFTFPQGFLTAVLQTHARRYNMAIDDLKFRTTVMDVDGPAAVSGPPSSGVYVYGLFLEGATWDMTNRCLVEAKHAEQSVVMPVMWLEPVPLSTPDPPGTYTCPLYKTALRAGVLSTTGLSTNYVTSLQLPCPVDADPDSPTPVASWNPVSPDHWVLRGTALLCAPPPS